MKFESTVTYPADLQTTQAMLLDPAYLDFRVRELGVPIEEKSIETVDGAARVSILAAVPPQFVPASYRKFVPPNLKVRIVEDWQAPAGDRSPTGTMTVEVRGMPVRAQASFRLDAEGGSTLRSYLGDLAVSIPFVGAKIEQTVVTGLGRFVAAEQAAATRWLAGER